MKEIPPFLYTKTKDMNKILKIIDVAADGKLKMPDGSPVETVALDSVSVLWGIQQEVSSALAERRAERKHYDISEAKATMLDWNLARRPIKKIYNRLSASPIKYLVMTAREKDLYKQNGENENDLKKIGVTPDVMKGLEYEVNLALHLMFDEGNNWQFETTKAQGALGAIFPVKKTAKKIDWEKLFEYSGTLKVADEKEEDDDEVIERTAKSAEKNTKKPTQADLIVFARTHGVEPAMLGTILKAAGFNGYNPDQHEAMEQAVLSAAPVQA